MTWERDRERGYEEQFARREEQAFKAAALRNRQLALWAAQKLQLSGQAADSYVQTLAGDVAHARGRGIIAKIVQDLAAARVALTERQVAAEFDRLDAEAAAALRDA